MSDKAYQEKQMAEYEAEARKKKQQEEQAIVEAENLQDDQTIMNENIMLEEQQQAEAAQQQDESNFPAWIRDSYEALKFESEYAKADPAQKESFLSDLKQSFQDLVDGNFIKAFEETAQGFKAVFEDAKSMFLNLGEQRITMQGFGLNDNPIETAINLVKSLDTNSLDVSGLKNEQSRYNAWKGAEENNLNVKGLNADEESSFQQKSNTAPSLEKR